MKKGIALLMVMGMLASLTVPVCAAETITTYRGDTELVLEEAGDVDITKEELVEKSQTVMKDAEDIAVFMYMDVDANVSYEDEGTQMSMDMAINADMQDNRKGGMEYKSENMNMSFFGMEMTEESEEYIFPNASGTTVSVKKESSSEADEENNGEWVAEVEDEDEDEDDDDDSSMLDTGFSDDVFESFELLDKKYTDGEQEYYVLKGKTSEVMGESFSDLGDMFGDIDTDADCYLVCADDGMVVSLYIDLGEMQGAEIEEGMEMSFSKFLISMYTDDAVEITIPEEVQAAGDAAA